HPSLGRWCRLDKLPPTGCSVAARFRGNKRQCQLVNGRFIVIENDMAEQRKSISRCPFRGSYWGSVTPRLYPAWNCHPPGVDGGMESYKRGSHTVWDCKSHLVWVTKYRYQRLGGDVGERCRELLRETARAHEMVVHAGSINRDHVHMLLSIPPSLSVSRAVQYLKGRSSHK